LIHFAQTQNLYKNAKTYRKIGANPVQFTPEVTLGALAQIVVLVFGFGVFYQRMASIEKLGEALGKRVERVETTLTEQAAALNRLIGRQDARDEARDQRERHK
jgi:hypothetical protein